MTQIVVNPSRDPRVEDPSNLWLIDPSARLLVPVAVRLRISANAISLSGLLFGAAAALAYYRWPQPGWAAIGLLISVAWLVTDSLDGMVARATGTSSAFGRELDGMCDHIVFLMIYIALARSMGDVAIDLLVVAAASAHAVQASLYEAERDRFHRRLNGRPIGAAHPPSRNPAARLYHWIMGWLEGASAPFDRVLSCAPAATALRNTYVQAAIPVLRTMLPLSQNLRLVALFVACVCGRMTMFLWYELVALSVLTAIGILWHRQVEARVAALAS